MSILSSRVLARTTRTIGRRAAGVVGSTCLLGLREGLLLGAVPCKLRIRSAVELLHFLALLGGDGGVELDRIVKLRMGKGGELVQGRHILVDLLNDSHGLRLKGTEILTLVW